MRGSRALTVQRSELAEAIAQLLDSGVFEEPVHVERLAGVERYPTRCGASSAATLVIATPSCQAVFLLHGVTTCVKALLERS